MLESGTNPNGDLPDLNNLGLTMTGNCRCTNSRLPRFPSNLLTDVVNADLCKGFDQKTGEDILKKAHPAWTISQCPCGEDCKLTNWFIGHQIPLIDLNPAGITLVVYVRRGIVSGSVFNGEPAYEGQQPCEITVPVFNTTCQGVPLCAPLKGQVTLYCQQGKCEKAKWLQ